jgi:hypothetical protein
MTSNKRHWKRISWLSFLSLAIWGGIQVCVHGVTLKLGWGWFIQPLGVAAISFPQALGITSLVWLVIGRANLKERSFNLDPEDNEESSMVLSTINQTLTSLFGLGILYIYHLLM